MFLISTFILTKLLLQLLVSGDVMPADELPEPIGGLTLVYGGRGEPVHGALPVLPVSRCV